MQTLATGINNRHSISLRLQGFTLIELLVVVVILAVVLASGMTFLRSGSHERRIEQEGQRIINLLEFLCEQSIVQNRPQGLGFSDNGYTALKAPDQAGAILAGTTAQGGRSVRQAPWQPVTVGGDNPWSVPEFLQIQLFSGARPIPLKETFPDTPHIVCDSSGHLPDFSLRLRPRDGGAVYDLRYQQDGLPDAVNRHSGEAVMRKGSNWRFYWLSADEL